MSRIVVFGAGGRAGRRIVAEAQRRGHEVVAVVRDPAAHPEITGVTGDATDVADVRRLTDGADAVVSAVARMDVPATELYTAVTRALVDGMGAGRLLTVGIGTMLEVTPGIRLMDAPDFPEEGKAFSDGHVAELELLQASPEALDWAVLTPAPVMLEETALEGVALQTRAGPGLMQAEDPELSFADIAAAMLDEIEAPRHHRSQFSVARL